jgi:tRNA 2-thiouridine synthesizing protein A
MTLSATLASKAQLSINACNQPCPLPLLKLKQALRGMNQGDKVLLIASDPHSQQDISRFCDIAGHVLHHTDTEDAYFYFLIEKNG